MNSQYHDPSESPITMDRQQEHSAQISIKLFASGDYTGL